MYRQARAWLYHNSALVGSSVRARSEEHTSELQSRSDLVCRLLLEKKKQQNEANQCTVASASTRGAVHGPQKQRGRRNREGLGQRALPLRDSSHDLAHQRPRRIRQV